MLNLHLVDLDYLILFIIMLSQHLGAEGTSFRASSRARCHLPINSNGKGLQEVLSEKVVIEEDIDLGTQEQKLLELGVIHDAANILSGLQIFKERMLSSFSGTITQEQEQLLEAMGHSVSFLGIVLQETLQPVKRLEVSEKQWIDLQEVMASFINMMKNFVDRPDVTLALKASSTAMAYLNVHRLELILMNLVKNAYKFSPQEGSIELSFERLSEEQSPLGVMSLCVSVRDDGPGISDLDIPHIFQPFFSKSKNGEGVGLGLNIVKSLVESLAGVIEVRSQVQDLDAGASFTQFDIYLPCEFKDEHSSPSGFSATKQELIGDYESFFRAREFIYVDDDQENRSLMTKVLQLFSVESRAYPDAQEPLHSLDTYPAGSIVLLDYCLSDGNGVDLAEKIYALRKDLHIFILSGYGGLDQEYSDLLKEGVIRSFLTKPYAPRTLLEDLYITCLAWEEMSD